MHPKHPVLQIEDCSRLKEADVTTKCTILSRTLEIKGIVR
jgi:hypothetical protein